VFRRLIVLASAALITAALAGCGNTDSWVEAHAASGWPAQYGDAANSSYAGVAGAEALDLEWSRSVKGELGAAVAIGSGHYLAVNGQTPAGCSLMVWETDNNGRQRWCTRLWQGGGSSSPLWDGFDNLYIGQPGAMMSFPPTQWVRWRQPVIGMPTTPRILAPGHLLVVTHLGQVLLFDAQRGTVMGTPLDLVAGINPTDSQRGLADCQLGRPRCPVGAGVCRRCGHRGGAGVATRRACARARRAEIQPGTKPRAVGGLDQRRREGRRDGQPGGVCGRFDDLPQRPR
jgi:hypothetical protein